MNETQERTLKVLDDLGESSVAVARRLLELGVRGQRADAECCPLARYLGDCGLPGSKVTAEYIVQGDTCTTTPYAVRDFIHDFDNERYDFLLPPVKG